MFTKLSLAAAAALAAFAVAMSTCPSPYFPVGERGACAYYNQFDSVDWCQAAGRCLDIAGELVTDLGIVRDIGDSLNSSAGWLLIGGTDLLVERGRNRTGWLWSNGSVIVAPDADWGLAAPSMSSETDDFLGVSWAGIADVRFEYLCAFICQPVVTPNSGQFRRTSFLRLGNISPYYCFTELTNVKLESECALRCADRWQCRAAIHNRADGRCRMLDFTDASVGDDIETDPNWTKLVKVY